MKCQQNYYSINRPSAMDVTLIRNGYNLQRRKMYIENPRHNLRSSVQLLWEESLGDSPNIIKRQKELSAQLVKETYTKVIDKKLEDELKLNKSSFRVMMAAEKEPATARNYSQSRPNYYDSLNREIEHRDERKNPSSIDSPVKDHKKSQSLSKAVFGYDIDRNAFQKESYLSKILGDRLSPYLNRKNGNTIESEGMGRHQSFTINQPISLKY